MIEARQLFPGLGGMAGFAAHSLAIRANLLHSNLELSLVRIGMAVGAGQFIPVIRDRLWFEATALLVAIGARDCHVAAGKDESGFLVARQRKGGWPIALQIVTALTGVEVRCSSKLSGVFIIMAVSAALELYLKQSFFALGNMTARALHRAVSTLKGIRRSGVVLYGEG